MRILAYTLSGADNRAYFYDTAPKSIFCRTYGGVVDKEFAPVRLTLERPVMDVSFTYDGQAIVTEKFKQFCAKRGFEGGRFVQVNYEPVLYHFTAGRTLIVDEARSSIEYGRLCKTCGQYNSIAGGTVLDRSFQHDIDTGLFRTDISYGMNRGVGPNIIVGLSDRAAAQEAGLSGVHFQRVEAWFRHSISLFPITVSRQQAERIAGALADDEISIRMDNFNMDRPGNPFYEALAPGGKTVLSYGDGDGTEAFCAALGRTLDKDAELAPTIARPGSLVLGGGPKVLIGRYGISAFLVGRQPDDRLRS
ncbi:MAG: hypothetical protein ACR2OM_10000 [Aestuariivirgaceae bacterium]